MNDLDPGIVNADDGLPGYEPEGVAEITQQIVDMESELLPSNDEENEEDLVVRLPFHSLPPEYDLDPKHPTVVMHSQACNDDDVSEHSLGRLYSMHVGPTPTVLTLKDQQLLEDRLIAIGLAMEPGSWSSPEQASEHDIRLLFPLQYPYPQASPDRKVRVFLIAYLLMIGGDSALDYGEMADLASRLINPADRYAHDRGRRGRLFVLWACTHRYAIRLEDLSAANLQHTEAEYLMAQIIVLAWWNGMTHERFRRLQRIGEVLNLQKDFVLSLFSEAGEALFGGHFDCSSFVKGNASVVSAIIGCLASPRLMNVLPGYVAFTLPTQADPLDSEPWQLLVPFKQILE